ncbi:MAG: C4-dicarboxylate ABC transporter substrate-binding protein, partial [Polaromonas sp.]
RVWSKLSEQDKKIFTEAAKKSVAAQRKKVNDDEANGVAQLRKDGMQVIEQVRADSFRDALKPAYASYAKEFGAER